MLEEQARSVFLAALDCAPEQWAAFLDEACSGNAELRARVDDLLRAHQGLGSIHVDAAELPTISSAEQAGERVGTLIGPYKLLQKIGEGGMGTVYMAEQSHPVQRKVALKIIKPGMDSDQIVARFEAERQALAIMDHPNIARVLDVGATGSGRPYFVMELVKGKAITSYCDERHLTPRERLELFVGVCQAVQHAHQKGIIHRDLKPSNVLVALYDGRPVPKVIDFGVAKAMGQKLTDGTLFTQFGQVVGTLEYMSPEQAEPNQLDIDTRSDIYSLGVLLYELLTGTTPIQRQRLKEGALLEALRMIREEEPPRPSTRLSTTEQLPSIAANRGLEPKKLSGLVRGELDWIAMKALEKDRNRRYETANGFAQDIERYLKDEAVLACPPSASYKLRKLMQRNKGAVAAIGSLLVTLVLGITGTSIGLFRARSAQAEAIHERDKAMEAQKQEMLASQKAQTNYHRARQAVDVMFTQVAEKWLGHNASLEPLQKHFLLEASRFYEDFAKEESSDPQVRLERANAYRRLGEIHHKLGETAEAEKAFKKATAILSELSTQYPSDWDFIWALADNYYQHGFMLQFSERTVDALDTYKKAVLCYERLVGQFPDQPKYQLNLAQSVGGMASVLFDTNLHKESEQSYRRCLSLIESLPADFAQDPDCRFYLGLMESELSDRLLKMGQSREARLLFYRGKAIYEKLVEEYPREPKYCNEFSWSLKIEGDQLRGTNTTEAEKSLRRALALEEKQVVESPRVPDYRFVVGTIYLSLGILLKETGRPEEAEEDLRLAIEIFEKLLNDFPGLKPSNYLTHLFTTRDTLISLLASSDKQHALEEAVQQARTVELWEKLRTKFSNQPRYLPEDGWMYRKLASLLVKLPNRFIDAEAMHARDVATFKALVADAKGSNPWLEQLAQSHRQWGFDLWHIDRTKEAEAAFQQAIKLLECPSNSSADVEDGRNSLLMDTHIQIAHLQSDNRRWREVEHSYSRLIERFPKNALIHSKLSRLLSTCPETKLRDPKRAFELAKKATELAPQEGNHWNTLGLAQYRVGNWKAAITSLTKSNQLLKGNELSFNAFFLAMAEWQLGHKNKARSWYDKAITWMIKNRPTDEELIRFRAEAEEVLQIEKKLTPK
jgi:serine/threonine protein kinase/tetratricopeptide (TPR) repeat protein